MKKTLQLLAIAWWIVFSVSEVNAGKRRGGCSDGSCGLCPSGACQQGQCTNCPNGQCPGGVCVGDQCTDGNCSVILNSSLNASAEAVDDLDEVNAARVAKGLPAYIRDENLTKGALHVVKYRASNRIHGHYNDHSGLPLGVTALAAGAEGDASTPEMRASWNPAIGFVACCAHERIVHDYFKRPHTPTHAGAAKVVVGGQQYCEIFVNVGPATRK